MNALQHIRSVLQQAAKSSKAEHSVFYKTGVGEYAEHDRFINVDVPTLRQVAKEFKELSRKDLQCLVESLINEERLLALFILVGQYQKADANNKDELYQFYMSNLKHVNNWNLVDSSAHLILGEYLSNKDKTILITLAQSQIMWERRIAVVSTWWFIRENELGWTFQIAELLLKDERDLIHKAVGWMLREAGKRNQAELITFLDKFSTSMPRTMLRYSIEKFPDSQRKAYLMRK